MTRRTVDPTYRPVDKSILTRIIFVVACHVLLASLIYASVAGINIHNTLPVHIYPTDTNILTSDQANPWAIETYQRFQTAGILPESFQSITIQPHGDNIELTDFIRATAIRRGGITATKCQTGSKGAETCKLMAAIPEPMANELRELSTTTFDQQQDWISSQPTSTVWNHKLEADPLVLTDIKVTIPFAELGPLRDRYTTFQRTGELATVISIIFSGILIPISWLIAGSDIQDIVRRYRRHQLARSTYD